ncbi:hypothetical protein [Haloarcula marina]|uniref:hypothetical protein n=1 Tax=Haloarcula marina TaxID=2961574 RepID=UPI0020B74FF7|nr:hypothetical protein [Halomicroarcula marina]
MRRRAVLAGLAGLSGVGGLAGCNALGAAEDDADGDPEVTPAPVPSATATAADPWRRFDDEVCPRFDRRTDQTVCSHIQTDESGLRLVPDRPVVSLVEGDPANPLRVTLYWRVEGDLTVFANDWYLFKRRAAAQGAEWTNVATADPGGETATLRTDERHEWLLDTTTRDTGENVESVATKLSPGRYAFAVQTVGQNSTVYTECLALFDVVDESAEP